MREQTAQQPDALALVAFNRAMSDHADGLKTFAARMLGDPMSAEDVAQDAFLALYRHLEQVPSSAFRPWLYRVARNLCLDQLRRRKFKLRLFRDVEKDDDCPFRIWKDQSGRYMDHNTVRTLLKEGRAGPLDGFSYRDGRTYSAMLQLEDGDDVLVENRHGEVAGIVESSADVSPHTIAFAFGWGNPRDPRPVREQGSNVQALTSDDSRYDTVTGLALQSAIPVNVRRASSTNARIQ